MNRLMVGLLAVSLTVFCVIVPSLWDTSSSSSTSPSAHGGPSEKSTPMPLSKMAQHSVEVSTPNKARPPQDDDPTPQDPLFVERGSRPPPPPPLLLGSDKGYLCGERALAVFGVAFRVDTADSPLSFLVTQTKGTNRTSGADVRFNARLLTESLMVSGLIEPLERPSSSNSPQQWRVRFQLPPTVSVDTTRNINARIDIIVTWVASRFVGQKWLLPNRNDAPPYAEKKRKCLDLRLVGDDCQRFGVTLWNSSVTLPVPKHVAAAGGIQRGNQDRSSQLCTGVDVGSQGAWYKQIKGSTESSTSLLKLYDDDVGLNRFQGHTYRWKPNDCTIREFTAADAHRCFASKQNKAGGGTTRVALFGDSMMVEQFEMLKSLFVGHDGKTTTGKFKKLRSMRFTAPNPDGGGELDVQFFRSYTTSGGHSVIAAPSTIIGQLVSFKPHVVLGNLAVLHWQQNERTLTDWERNLKEFSRLYAREVAALNLPKTRYYLGNTLIQMGRTQGLQPSRTDEFSGAARRILCGSAGGGFEYLDPYNMSASRRESAFDGQHWACYHQYGGVSFTISQMWLNMLCNTI